jgi:hypothetical protein
MAIRVPKKLIRWIKCFADRAAAPVGPRQAKLAAAGNFCRGAALLWQREKCF